MDIGESLFELLCDQSASSQRVRRLTLQSFLRGLQCTIDNATTLVDLYVIFQETKADETLSTEEEEHHSGLDFDGFLNCMEAIHMLRKEQGISAGTIKSFINELYCKVETMQNASLKTETGFMLDPKLLEVLKDSEPAIRDLFADHVWDNSRQGLQRPAWHSVCHQNARISWGELRTIARSFSLCPNLLSEQELEGVIHGIKGRGQLEGIIQKSMGGLMLPEFEEFLCRCAVLAMPALLGEQDAPVNWDEWSLPEVQEEAENHNSHGEIFLSLKALLTNHMRLQDRFVVSDNESEMEKVVAVNVLQTKLESFNLGTSPETVPPTPASKNHTPKARDRTNFLDFPKPKPAVGFWSSRPRSISPIYLPTTEKREVKPVPVQPASPPKPKLVPPKKEPVKPISKPRSASSSKVTRPSSAPGSRRSFSSTAPSLPPQTQYRPVVPRPQSANATQSKKVATIPESMPTPRQLVLPMSPEKELQELFEELKQRLTLQYEGGVALPVSQPLGVRMLRRAVPASHLNRASRPIVIKEILVEPEEDIPEQVSYILQASILNHNRGEYVSSLLGFAKAEQLWHAAVAGPSSGQGYVPTIPATIRMFFFLAKGSVLHSQGNDGQALEMFLGGQKNTLEELGEQHPLMASLLSGMGAVCYYAGRFDLGLRCYEIALAIRKKHFGMDNSDTGTASNNLGACFEMVDKWEQAFVHYKRAHIILKNILGPTHPRCAAVLRNLQRLEGLQHSGLQHNPLSLGFREDTKYLIQAGTFRIMAKAPAPKKDKLKGKKKKKKSKKKSH